MFAFGFFAVAVALYLMDSAVKNRNPLTTLADIVTRPNKARAILQDDDGKHRITPQTRNMIAGNTGPRTIGAVNDPLVNLIIEYARQQIGKPYGWGQEGPNAYDCSGLIWAAYGSVGIPIPRTTAGQIVGGTRVSRKNLRPGDLVFPYPGHVFLYIGNGQTIEAPHTGTKVRYGTVYGFFTARRYI